MDNTQNVKHFHLHVIPRDKTLTVQPKVLPIDEVYEKYFKSYIEENSSVSKSYQTR